MFGVVVFGNCILVLDVVAEFKSRLLMIFEDMSHLKIEVVLVDRMRKVIANTKEVGTSVEANLVDLDLVCKDYDSNVQALIDMPPPQKAALIEATTQMNGKASQKYIGLKWFDTVRNGCPDTIGLADGDPNITKISEVRDVLVKLRGKGRLVISTRTAATIIEKQKSEDVDSFLEDIQPLKVNLHKNILGKLTALKKKKS